MNENRNTQLVEDIYKQDLICDVIDNLRTAERANDALAFGSYRPVHVATMKENLEIAKRKIDNILRRIGS